MGKAHYCVLFILPLLLYNVVCGRHSMDYTDLLDTGASCGNKDNCESQFRYSAASTNCECDPQCHQYNDCCINADQATASRRRLSRTCLRYGTEDKEAVYVVSKCTRSWRGARNIRQKCEVLNDVSDPVVASPATDTRNNITYRNLYCAECNSANKNYLQSWDIRVQCPTSENATFTFDDLSEDYISENLVYNGEKWGIQYLNVNQSREVFHPCEVVFRMPEELKNHARFCRPDAIGSCHPTWRQFTVKTQCEAYMAVVYHENETYRNPHCALCNFVDVDELKCAVTLLSRKRPSMSFTLLLDVNMRDGNKVGETQSNRCSEGMKYDPFFKKCRTLTCALPGFVIVDGRCIRQ